MAHAVLLRPKSTVGAIVDQDGVVMIFDASIDQHTKSADVTKHPTERTANISDHIQLQPVELTITGTLTNTPLFRLTGEDPEADRARRQLEVLEQMQASRELVAIATGLTIYEDMAIREIQVSRAAGRGLNALDVTVHFVQVFRVTAQFVEVDPSIFADDVRHSAADEEGGEDDDGLLQRLRNQTVFSVVTEGVANALAGTDFGDAIVNAFSNPLE